MKRTRHVSAGRWLGGLSATALIAGGLGVIATPAQAAPAQITDAEFVWSVNEESGGGAFFGGCNFLVAGEAGDNGGSSVWRESAGLYSTQDGNASIRKPDADDGYVTPTWSTKCQDAQGNNVTTQLGSSTKNEVVLTAGTGTVDPEANTAQIAWDASFTIVYYGGMTYWSISDPVLTINADGSGQVTGTGSGYGADMYQPEVWTELPETEITLATFDSADISADGVSIATDYAGVEVEGDDSGTFNPQNRTVEGWGSFPQSWVDFNLLTGQSAYWYTSGGVVDPKKPAAPITLSWTAASEPGDGEPTDPGTPSDGENIDVDVEIPEAAPVDPGDPTDPGDPGEDPVFKWTVNGDVANLGSAEQLASGAFRADGSLPTVTVTDTRPNSAGWTLSGQASAFNATSGGNSFAAEGLGWTPSVTGADTAYAGNQVTPETNGGLSTVKTLAGATSAHDSDVTAGASLELRAPTGTPSGDYRSTLTITAVSK